ncbi:ATP-binding protein [Chromatiaceae bacterium AAb-1]|nr:ATP-binding protein [Chromatiaceae bacterium AAb-1]
MPPADKADMQSPVHPYVKSFAALCRKAGTFQLAVLSCVLLIMTTALLSLAYSVILYNQPDWQHMKGAVMVAVVSAPFAVGIMFYLALHLDAALSYLEDSAHQERLLNESMQDNIRQLNFEIEERKKAFQAKRRAVDELRKEIAERKKAQAALEKSYHDKGKFIATLSHELRTPLNGIVGLTQRLLDSQLTPEQHSWANTIFSSAEALGNIFNDIIDLDKIDRQDLDIVYQSIPLQPFLNDIANFAELICQQKGLQFALQTEGELAVYLKLDPTRLRQILWNLLNNAVKFTAKGTVRLFCRVEAVPDIRLTFTVSDTGIGISAAEQQRIFDMYYKSNDGRRLSIAGSGIGLSVSKALIEAMHGQIEVHSEVNRGSTFTVKLPSELMPAPQATAMVSCPALTVLLIEDIPLNAEIATSLLEQRGHTVVHAETGEDALALLETEDDIDLVLLDMQLPDMNGDEIARYIRNEPHLAAIPVVVLSANVRKAEEQLAGVKIDGALAKPINTGTLDQLLLQLFAPSALKQHQGTVESVIVQHEEILDQATLLDYLHSLGKDAMKRSAGLCSRLLPDYIKNLQELAVQQDWVIFREEAHKLKGAAASAGLKWIQQQAKYLEQETNDWSDAKQHLAELQNKTEQHLAALQEFIDNY